MLSVKKRKRIISDDLESPRSIKGQNVKPHEAPVSVSDLKCTLKETESAKNSRRIESIVNAPVSDQDKTSESWYLSSPIGGRMIRSDPIFSADEKFLIVATRDSIKVIATANSLLVRTIQLKLNPTTTISNKIVTTCLSPSKSSILWVACSDGSIFSVDWMTGTGADSFWTVSSTGCIHMTVASMESCGRKRDVVFTTENRKDGGYRTTANELTDPNGPIPISVRTIYTSKEPIQFLKAAADGSVIVGASGKKLLVGRLRSTQFDTVDKIKFEFRTLESTEFITSLDIKLSKRNDPNVHTKSKVQNIPVVNLVIGNTKGVIFIHEDLAGKLFGQPQNEPTVSAVGFIPTKLHWHRQTVHSVKWSLDGNYIISGGSENVLVLWQLETGKQEFLPHLSGVIEQIVVSPQGSSYAIQLSDNSAMILSTADLLPKMNIAGIQIPIIQSSKLTDPATHRMMRSHWPNPLVQKTPAIVNPNSPSQILLAVGPIGEIQDKEPLIMSNPYLQTFDLTTCKSISNQSMTRTNITHVNAAPAACNLVEPRVMHLKISFDGLWLATVDEWGPNPHDYDFLKHSGKDFSLEMRCRREVHLKFWQWDSSSKTWHLVSRIDMPHLFYDGSGESGSILDLVADPRCLRFTTIGTDRTIKFWHTKSRIRDGLLVRGHHNEVLKNWRCTHVVKLEKLNNNNVDSTHYNECPATGCLSISEDGSVLAAAIGSENAFLHLINTETGDIRSSYPGLIENEIFGLEFLGQDLIVLSNKLLSFDVVLEETRHAFKLRSSIGNLAVDQKREMIHLATNPLSKTFAVALPKLSTGDDQLVGARSEFVVFHQDKLKPLYRNMFPSLITNLLPAVCSEGYLILDSFAEIYTVSRRGTQALTSLAQSTSALQPDASADETIALHSEADVIESDGNEDELLVQTFTPEIEVNDVDGELPVVTQHQLTTILDIGPAFALPPVEELFYQVAGLFTNKTLTQPVC